MYKVNIFRQCFSIHVIFTTYFIYRETYNNFKSLSNCMLPPLPQVFFLSWCQFHTCKMCAHTKTITLISHTHTFLFTFFLALGDPINKNGILYENIPLAVL